MWTTILIALGVAIIIAMMSYAIYLLMALQKQKKSFQKARLARVNRLKESIQIIARAMQNGDCNHSEGVIRLKMLLDPLGLTLRSYQSMFTLYEVVMDMPTHDSRRLLKKNERMRLDLKRESSEADLEDKIMSELHQLIADIKNY